MDVKPEDFEEYNKLEREVLEEADAETKAQRREEEEKSREEEEEKNRRLYGSNQGANYARRG